MSNATRTKTHPGELSPTAYNRERKSKVGAFVSNVAEAVMVTAEKTDVDNKSAHYFILLAQAWTNAPKKRLADSTLMRSDIQEDFEAAKDGAEKAVTDLHKAMTKAFASGDGPKPRLSMEDARRNSTKGIRQRKTVLENTIECIKMDPALARDVYVRAAIKGKDGLSWKAVQEILSTPQLARATGSEMKMVVGRAKDGRMRMMTPDYEKTHNVETRTLECGTVEEYTETTFGNKGNTENVEVIITKEPGGELCKELVAQVHEHTKQLAAAKSGLRIHMAEARNPECEIRESRPRKDNA